MPLSNLGAKEMQPNRKAVLLSDEEACARYGKIIEMVRCGSRLLAADVKKYLDEICWEPEVIREALNKAADSAQFPFGRAMFMATFTAGSTLALIATAHVDRQPSPLSLTFMLKLEERENVFKVSKLLSYNPPRPFAPQWQDQSRGQFSHPRLGVMEAGYNPGQPYGPGPNGYPGFRTSVFNPGVGFVKQSQIDLLVTSFEEIKPYFEILEKRHFDTQHEMAIFETIMQRSCGPDLRAYWRFNMIGRWDEGQDAGARLLLETYEVGHEGEETKISSYQTAFGTYLDGIPPGHSTMQPPYSSI
jgi:hypothetical protein